MVRKILSIIDIIKIITEFLCISGRSFASESLDATLDGRKADGAYTFETGEVYAGSLPPVQTTLKRSVQKMSYDSTFSLLF